MNQETIIKQTQKVLRQGVLQKQSRFLKSWRKRWVVLTSNYLFTFKDERQYHSPTESIPLKDILSIKGAEQQFEHQNSIKIQTKETTFYFTAESAVEKEAWIGSIGKAMVKANHAEIED